MPYLGGYDYQGGFGGFIGGLAKRVGRGATGFLTGGPLGGLGGILSSGPQMPRIALPSFTARAPQTHASASPGMTAKGAPSGYRLNKSSYFLKDGTFVEAGTKWVKVRRRNPANARALRRSLSRVESFGGLVKRTRKSIRKVKSL